MGKLGELCWAAAVSRPEICALPARIASRVNARSGSDAYRINELVRAAKDWQHATALKYASSSRPWKTPGGGGKAKVDLCNRGEKVHSGPMSLAGWSDAAEWGPVDRRGLPIGLCDRLNVVDFVGSVPYFAMDAQVYPEAGQKQLGRRRLRAK